MDNLFQSQDTSSDLLSQVPSYLIAADNHNIGNSMGGSWFDPSTWETKFDNSGKFIATSILSGANSLYNSGASAANWFGAEADLNDTSKWISGLDDDLGKYYDTNRQAVDLAGFIGTSFIPGLGGIKLLNAGQNALKAGISSGFIGGNLAKATGLLVPQTEMYVSLASKQIIGSTATFSAINSNTVLALAAGLGQNILEAAAFETAVQATMFKSPILKDQDGYDIVKNIALGGLVGGAIGGAIEGARTFGTIRKAVISANPESKLFSSRVQVHEATPESQNIILQAEDRDFRPSPVSVEGANVDVNKKLYTAATEKANNSIRSSINSLSKSDTELGNMVADSVHDLDHVQMFNNFLHSSEIGRLSSSLQVEKDISKAAKNLDTNTASNLHVRYVNLTGEAAGVVSDSAPIISNIADIIPAKGSVDSFVKEFGFSTKKSWSASSLEGSDAHLESEARNIWAQNTLKEIPKDTRISYDDFPLLERALQDGQLEIKIVNADGSVSIPASRKDLMDHIVQTKPEVAQDLLERSVLEGKVPVEQGTAAISKIVNMRQSALEGSIDTASVDDYFALQTADRNYKKSLVAKGLVSNTSEVKSISYLPSVAKIGYRTPEGLADLNGNVADGMVWLKQQQELFQQSADRVFASGAGTEIVANAPELPLRILQKASAINDTASLFKSANGAYDSPVSIAQQIGANVTRPLKEKLRKTTADTFEGALVSMGNKQVAAIEHDVINRELSATTEKYVVDTEGITGQPFALVSRKIRDYQIELESNPNAVAPNLQEGAREFIPIKNEETFRVFAAQVERDGSRTQQFKQISATQGHEDNKFTDIVRPIRTSPIDYPFVAFVKDSKITGAGHTTMIHAASEKELLALADKVPTEKGYKVLYKNDAEAYYQARNEYEYSRTLNENYIDSELKSSGVDSNFFVKTDPQRIVNDILQQHLRADDVVATELVRLKYQPQMDWLADQGSQYSKIESSRYGSTLSKVEKTGANPYTDITKTMLDVSKTSEYPLLQSFNRALDTATSRVVGAVRDVINTAKTPKDLDSINSLLQEAGYNNAYQDAATVLLANHTAPKAELSKFIRTSNAILSRFTLALDPLNALNNAIGANILRGTELKQITDAIKGGNSDIAGRLASIGKISLPGISDEVLSPTKLIAGAIKNFYKDDGVLLSRYKSEGLIKDSLAQFKSIQDDFTLKGTESVGELSSRINSAFSKAKELSQVGEKFTGNKLAEEFNRFISADVMRQITDVAESAGILTSAESKAYRNTFVNRVEGNTIASQRPIIFQGPIGQAVGLFQSYQFNLMQQLFRYIGEGTGKDAAMLLGLQSTMYGINGLPAFNFINTHIVGTLSGNPNHTDLYDATYGIAGKSAGDFLMYGIPSSIIQTNLYSRGDINPRQLTIIPNSLSQVPIIGAYGKLFSEMKNTVEKIGAGGNVWESVLQGIEHNGISRPLAGIAQVAQSTVGSGKVFSTTSKGDILYQNDLLSLATLSRLAGGRPLDEAIINDGVYRVTAYEAAQREQKKLLAESVKSTGIATQSPNTDSVSKFAEAYAATGGKTAQFNKWMLKEIVTANTPRSEKIRAQLQSPFSQKMQTLMGGRDTGYGSEE